MNFSKISFLAFTVITCPIIAAQCVQIREEYASRTIECIATCDCDGIYPDYCAAYLRATHPLLYWAKQPPCLLVCWIAYLKGLLTESSKEQENDTSWHFMNTPKKDDVYLEKHED